MRADSADLCRCAMSRRSALDGGYAIMLLDSPSQDGSILTKNALDAVWELNSAVYSIEVSAE